MDEPIRTEPLSDQVDSPCFACGLRSVRRVATWLVLPPLAASSETHGLSSCDEHLERSQYVVTYYADDLDKMHRLLNA